MDIIALLTHQQAVYVAKMTKTASKRYLIETANY